MPSNSRFAVAVHVLALIAQAGEGALKSDQIALSVNTHPVVIRRLLCVLSAAKLVVSQTGATGGYRLARSPRRISLLDVYRAVEGRSVFALHRPRLNPHCLIGCNIETVLGGVLEEADLAMERVLAKIMLEDVLLRLQACHQAQRSAKSRQNLSRKAFVT